MNKPCAKCNKTVYPTEKVNCLDKIWHKACFKCDVCGLTLNMKNYKGYKKIPYCSAHYPTTKFTAVADTPENMRIAANTQNQSQVKYHAKFEGEKGKYTSVADDPETRRIRQNTEQISSIKYHAQFEKDIKGKKIEVADDPETLRIRANMKNISQVSYHNVIQDKAKQEANRPVEGEQGKGARKQSGPANYKRQPGSINDYDPMAQQQQQPQQQQQQPGGGGGEPQHPTFSKPEVSIDGGRRPSAPRWEPPPVIDPTQRSQRKVGSIHDYDPLNDKYGSIVGAGGASPARPAENKDRYSAGNLEEESYPAPSRGPPQAYYPAAQPEPPQPAPPQPAPPQPSYQLQQEASQLAYPDPTQNRYQPPSTQPQFDPNPTPYQPPQQEYNPPPPQAYVPVPEPAPPAPAPTVGGPRYKAVYDYTAADDDEVSFNEDDIIINSEAIDEGWMTGTVERTGQHGMLPSNYVELII
ncbi:unnamed protein product [Owenia fusiformis]|uniref:Uncharacterized protein n=1 Tax=Owenia fusiformis TaxID=6347 RepID=A0A8J1TPD6_OWEFU|nr:unnamed protein product [Owenia fusiformis]